MLNFHFVSAHMAGNSQLITGDCSAVLIDASLPFCAEETIENIKKALGGRKLERIFLSHSHYDHIGALPYIRKAFPDAKVYAHPYTIWVLSRPGAVKKMSELCTASGNFYGKGFCGYPPRYDDMGEILPLEDEQSFPFDGGNVTAIFTPGHTNDSVSIDFPQYEFFCPSETFGVKLREGQVQPCFLTGRQDAIDSIERMRKLGRRRFVFNHMEEPCSVAESEIYLERAMKCIDDSTELVCRLYDEGRDFDGIFEGYTERYWEESYRPYWPFEAFSLNAVAAIKVILKELRGK